MGLERITPYTNIFQCMLERTDAITNAILEPTTFVLAYRTVFSNKHYQLTVLPLLAVTHIHSLQIQSQVSHGKHSLHLYTLSGAVMRLPRHAWLYIQSFLTSDFVDRTQINRTSQPTFLSSKEGAPKFQVQSRRANEVL